MAGGDPEHTAATEGPAPPYREAWPRPARLQDQRLVAGPVVGSDLVVVVAEESVVALDPATGEELWPVERARGPAGPAVLVGDLVVFGEGSGDEAEAVAVAREDGEERWRVNTGSPFPGGATAADGRIFLGTRAGELLALEAEDGSVAWRFDVEGRIEGPPAVAGGRVFVAANDPDGRRGSAYAVDADTGEREWRFEVEGSSATELATGRTIGWSAVSAGDGLVFLGAGDQQVRALDAEDRREEWSAAARAPFGPGQVPALPGDLVIADFIGDVYRLDRETGEELWIFRVPGILATGSQAVVGGAVVVGDESGQVSAIDLESGLLVWKRDLGEARIDAVAADSDRVYVASRGGAVVALEHDPQGVLLEESSPTTLFPGVALLNYAAAFAIVMAALLLLFRVLSRGRREPRTGDGEEEEAQA